MAITLGNELRAAYFPADAGILGTPSNHANAARAIAAVVPKAQSDVSAPHAEPAYAAPARCSDSETAAHRTDRADNARANKTVDMEQLQREIQALVYSNTLR